MSTPRPPHQIVITKVADDESDDIEYAVVCPTPQPPDCHVWFECTECAKSDQKATEDEEDEGERTAHGVHHLLLDGDWMTESTGCAIKLTDVDLVDVLGGLPVGTHDVYVDYWGDGVWDVTLATTTEATA